jgi:hypothetical protein
MGLIQALFGSLELPPRTREIVTLTAAVLVESEYELVQHVPTPGGQEGFFIEGGDEAHPGERPEPWGPKRYAQAAELIGKYGNVLMPEDE